MLYNNFFFCIDRKGDFDIIQFYAIEEGDELNLIFLYFLIYIYTGKNY